MGDEEAEVIGVAELDRRLKHAVEGVTGREWIEGEVGSLKRAASGHVYFSLKDEREDAMIDCVMYRYQAQRARQVLEDGARVQLFGRATLWAPRGRLQLVAEQARPAGRGALLEALEQLKLKLAAEGLFAVERKRPLPPEPRVVGVVTSSAGAAFHDIRTVAFRRGGARLVLAPAQVQGEAAPASIVRALELIERYPGLDVIIVGRGGGAAEDLMAFNDERVVRRVAALRVPVVSAVGHEIDTTLTDLAADVRAATPSQAAELVIPDARARREALARLARQLARAVEARVTEDRATVERLRNRLSDPRFLIAERQQGLDLLGQELERLARRAIARRRSASELLYRRLATRHPRAVLAEARGELGPLSARLEAAVRFRLETFRRTLGERAARLEGMSPLSVLGRGYAIARREDGRAVRRASEVRVGEALELIVHDGRVGARVTRIDGAS
ncbi:MAG: exodeoxyribonuclease VII large subunit [Sorangiineae bacterium]|nr:exodeoxyribonuclease VII large subunit [Polyangiaceae bacterium]MEB2320893.1 exodeoxyribonuclease VII large subunit [Sorangiineae bacterium]